MHRLSIEVDCYKRYKSAYMHIRGKVRELPEGLVIIEGVLFAVKRKSNERTRVRPAKHSVRFALELAT